MASPRNGGGHSSHSAFLPASSPQTTSPPAKQEVVVNQGTNEVVRVEGVSKAFGDTHALTLAAIENMHRLEMTPIDEARAIKTMLTDGGMNQAQVAAELARTPSWVSARLSLLELPTAVQHKIAAGEIRPTVAAQAVTDLRKTGRAVLDRCTAHLATKHPLWDAARARCDNAGHPRLGRVNGVCGACWEAAIRADERGDTSATRTVRAEAVA